MTGDDWHWHAAGIEGCRREGEVFYDDDACDCVKGNAALDDSWDVSDIAGIAPDWTDGEDPVDFVRRQRGDL
jgi:hypothetical protein